MKVLELNKWPVQNETLEVPQCRYFSKESCLIDKIKGVDFSSRGDSFQSVLTPSFVKAVIAYVDVELDVVGEGHPFKAKVALYLWGFEVSVEHE